MNRRKFLSRVLTGAAVVAVGSKIPFAFSKMPKAPAVATIDGYNDYCNFSSVALEQSIRKTLEQAAEELGYRAGQSVRALQATIFDYQPTAFGRI